MTLCDLHEYFSKFGLIIKIKIPKDKMGPKAIRCGFITFLETDSVRRVLVNQPHRLGGNRLIISMARDHDKRKKSTAGPCISESNQEGDDDSCSEHEMAGENAPPQLTIRVTIHNSKISESDLKAYFCQFGNVEKATITEHLATGGTRKLGFITFSDNSAFERGVLQAFHFLKGVPLHVQLGFQPAIVVVFFWLAANKLRVGKQSELDLSPYKIFVGDLPESTQDYDLYEHFSQFGIITEAFLLKGTEWHAPRRCGFILFRDTDAAKKALETQPHLLNGTQIFVSLARHTSMAESW
ncbi:unnamed protein product [Dibothriocephalus latus]|uniref:RRM domain-containing protein n=1 Tax=Dibothriocephalus latus TaxID=60516 RepID=A0A3P6U2I9_DIBLA|nr:unnamed protein product [Dibothriocephalus latus]